MASDTIIIDGDEVEFVTPMGIANVVVQPGKMIASGKTTIAGVPVCIVGDEKQVSVPNCDYTTPIHDAAGKGTLMIKALAGDQQAAVSKSGGAALILKGSQFESVFEVTVPAMDTSPVSAGGAPIPDTTPNYSGTGQLIPTNSSVKSK